MSIRYLAVFACSIVLCSLHPAPAGDLARIAGDYFLPRYDGPAVEPETPLARFRGKCRMRLFVEQPGRVTLDLTDSQVSSRYTQTMRFSVEASDGHRVLQGSLEPGQSGSFSFDAETPGLYQLHLDPGQNSTQLAVRGARLAIPAAETERCRVIRGSGRLWFYVPAGSTGFEVRLHGQGTGETAAVVVLDPGGREVARGSTAGSDRVIVEVPVAPEQDNALWSLRVVQAESGAFEDASFSLTGNVGSYVAQRPQDVVVPILRTRLPGVHRQGTAAKLELAATLLAPTSTFRKPSLSIRVTTGGSEVYRTRIDDVEPGAFRVAVPADDLAVGPHRLEITLGDADVVVASRTHEFFVVRRPNFLRPDKVTLDAGKPFFARGLYHVSPQDYELVKRQGFNIVQAHPDNVPKCEAAGLKAAAALYFGMRVDPDYYREKINAYKNGPTVICWMIMDEPAAHGMSLEVIQRGYGVIRAADPDRPAYMCLCRPEAYATYGMATDVIAIDVYPIREGRDDLSRISQALAVAQRDVPGQTVWFIGQVWSWPGRDDPNRRRLVTAAEHRCMSYLALTHGNVRGLMWYSFRDPDWYLPTSNPEVWAAAKQLNHELTVLEPVLLKPNRWEKTIAGSHDGSIRVAMKEHDGARYLIAVNPNYRPTRVGIPVGNEHRDADAEVVFENRRVPLEAGVLTDRFDPLAVHVYKM